MGCVENAGEVQEIYRNKKMQDLNMGEMILGLMKIIPESLYLEFSQQNDM